MLWAIGAWLAWALLRDWPQAALAATLTPAWLAGEWFEATRGLTDADQIVSDGLLLLAITYLTAAVGGPSATRRALVWIGGVALIPLVIFVALSSEFGYSAPERMVPASLRAIGWNVALAPPLLLAWWLRGKTAWINCVAAVWVVALGATEFRERWQYAPGSAQFAPWHELAMYALCALGSIGLIAWGMAEARKERVNLGVAGFALTVLGFYFSTVMDKLGRSASLIGLGLIFLLGGWQLEKARRRLVARLERRT